MPSQELQVAIAGAGLGGLCLAQALKKQGIAFRVYERDAAIDSRPQGYRIRIDATGQSALTACLPTELYDAFRWSCARARSGGQLLDTALAPIEGRPARSWTLAVVDEQGEHQGDLSADRVVLRQIMMSGIEDHVQFGHGLQDFEDRPDGTVELRFENGRVRSAGVLVGADGTGSVVRRGRFSFVEPAPTGAACIYGKTPISPGHAITDRLLGGTTVVFAEDAAVIIDAMIFHRPEADDASTALPDDYVYWAIFGRERGLDLHEDDTPGSARLLALVERLSKPWSEDLRALFRVAAPATISALPARSASALPWWPSSRITALGDALHVMSPAGGLGANTALKDAEMLSRQLANIVRCRTPLLTAIAAYENDMRRRANEAMAASHEGEARLVGEGADDDR